MALLYHGSPLHSVGKMTRLHEAWTPTYNTRACKIVTRRCAFIRCNLESDSQTYRVSYMRSGFIHAPRRTISISWAYSGHKSHSFAVVHIRTYFRTDVENLIVISSLRGCFPTETTDIECSKSNTHTVRSSSFIVIAVENNLDSKISRQ